MGVNWAEYFCCKQGVVFAIKKSPTGEPDGDFGFSVGARHAVPLCSKPKKGLELHADAVTEEVGILRITASAGSGGFVNIAGEEVGGLDLVGQIGGQGPSGNHIKLGADLVFAVGAAHTVLATSSVVVM